jgi:hypothetical protein
MTGPANSAADVIGLLRIRRCSERPCLSQSRRARDESD